MIVQQKLIQYSNPIEEWLSELKPDTIEACLKLSKSLGYVSHDTTIPPCEKCEVYQSWLKKREIQGGLKWSSKNTKNG